MIRMKPALLGMAALSLGLAAPAFAEAPPLPGDWHGTLQSQSGPVTLILHVTAEAGGKLKAQVENAYQAPGQMADVSSISAENGHLSWKVDRIGATYEGDWSDADRQWKGKFNQGIEAALAFEQGLPDPFPVVEGFDGLWEGTAELNGAKLRQALRIKTDQRGTLILYDSPDQMAMGLVAEKFAADGQAVSFSVLNGISSFKGTLSEDRKQIAGQFTTTVNDNVAPVTFTRTSDSSERKLVARPQEPKAPFPYRVEEVAFDNPQWPDVHLAGTLTLPEGAGPFPAAVMITGSGGQDRDEALMGHKPFAVIADYLTRNGIAVLRFDDRGIGESRSKTSYDSATSADLATDANAAFAFLRHRSEIDPLKVGFIGHSEGGMIGPIAMAENPYAAFLVTLAGPGTALDRLLVSQQRLLATTMGASQKQLDDQEPVMAAMFKAVAKAKTTEAGKAAAKAVLTPAAMAKLGLPPGTDEAVKDTLVGRFTGPWFRYFLHYDPVPNLSRIRVPLLALNGGLDLQVPADDNLEAIRAATQGNPDVTIVKLEGLNHLFQHAATGGVGEYASIEETWSPEALDIVAKWINRRFGK